MNQEVQLTLDDAVLEVLSLLTGQDLAYAPELDRYRVITRQLNRALRTNALDAEWSYYASSLALGRVFQGEKEVAIPTNVRPRIIGDDAVRLVDGEGNTQIWAYFLPRDALSKYEDRSGLWCSIEKQVIRFSRPFFQGEDGFEVVIPVMREPRMFRLPAKTKTVPASIRNQLVDFSYPDVVVARAAFYYAQSDPVMQPRAQTLEEGYKNLMYQLIERDTSITDTPYENTFLVPVENGLVPVGTSHRHPHSM